MGGVIIVGTLHGTTAGILTGCILPALSFIVTDALNPLRAANFTATDMTKEAYCHPTMRHLSLNYPGQASREPFTDGEANSTAK